jgi:hypothetical protein
LNGYIVGISRNLNPQHRPINPSNIDNLVFEKLVPNKTYNNVMNEIVNWSNNNQLVHNRINIGIVDRWWEDRIFHRNGGTISPFMFISAIDQLPIIIIDKIGNEFLMVVLPKQYYNQLNWVPTNTQRGPEEAPLLEFDINSLINLLATIHQSLNWVPIETILQYIPIDATKDLIT